MVQGRRVEHVNKAVEMFSHTLQLAGENMLQVCRTREHSYKQQALVCQPEWWDSELKSAKVNKFKCLNRFKKTNTEQHLLEYTNARRCFKNIYKKKETEYKCKLQHELINASID